MPKVTMVQHINVQITHRQRTQEWYEEDAERGGLDEQVACDVDLRPALKIPLDASTFLCSTMTAP
jgi:hypothetical protein